MQVLTVNTGYPVPASDEVRRQRGQTAPCGNQVGDGKNGGDNGKNVGDEGGMKHLTTFRSGKIAVLPGTNK